MDSTANWHFAGISPCFPLALPALLCFWLSPSLLLVAESSPSGESGSPHSIALPINISKTPRLAGKSKSHRTCCFLHCSYWFFLSVQNMKQTYIGSWCLHGWYESAMLNYWKVSIISHPLSAEAWTAPRPTILLSHNNMYVVPVVRSMEIRSQGLNTLAG